MPSHRIPKIIHYCWLSGNPYPDEIKRCIESWQKYLPDYKFVLWDTKRFDVDSLPWTKQAIEAKKYAFAADYIRLYALYNYGGIYLDTDVLLYKSFDDLLDLPYFIGQDFVGAFEPAVMGCEAGTEWVKHVMEYYVNRDFVNADGSMNIRNLPVVFFERLFERYNFRRVCSKEDFRYDENTFNIFAPVFFNGRNNVKPVRSALSYCSHLFANSWSDRRAGRLRDILPQSLLNIILGLNYHVIRKRRVHHYDPVFRQALRGDFRNGL